MSTFQNIYYKRTAATARACYVCCKPTTIVLATINAMDFIYTCKAHLSDKGFATKVIPSPRGISSEDIDRTKREWEEEQAIKRGEREREKDKDQDSEKEKKDIKPDTEEAGQKKSKEGSGGKSGSPASSSSPPPTVTHEKFILHREIFSMRQAEHRKARQTKAAKEMAPRLPGVPTGGLSRS